MNQDLSDGEAPDLLGVFDRALQTSARALARLLSTPADAVVTRVQPWGAAQRAPEDTACAVAFEVTGALSGTLIQILTAEDVARTVSHLLPRGEVNPAALSRPQRAALAEMGNIVVSAFLNEVSATLGTACLPSVPDLADGERAAEVHAWLRNAMARSSGGAAWLRAELSPHGPGFFLALAPED